MLTIYDKRIIGIIQKFTIFNNRFQEFQNFLNRKNKNDFEECHQFILFYDSENTIIYSKEIEVIKKQNFFYSSLLKIRLSIEKMALCIDHCLNKYSNFDKKTERAKKLYKIIDTRFATLCKIHSRILCNQKISSARFDKIKQEIRNLNLSKYKIIFLEIPKKDHYIVKELKAILDYSQNQDNNKNNNEGLASSAKVQLSTFVYFALTLGIIFEILNIIPYSLLDEHDIFLAIKLYIAVVIVFLFLSTIIYIVTLPFYIYDIVKLKYTIKYKTIPLLKKGALFYVLLTGVVNFLAANNIIWSEQTWIKTTQVIMPICRDITKYYLNQKTLLVYDRNLKKTILYVGTKDGIYYYYDQFKVKDLNASKYCDNNSSSQLKQTLLGFDTNVKENYLESHWKINNIKDSSFDYNDTLVIQSILKCNNDANNHLEKMSFNILNEPLTRNFNQLHDPRNLSEPFNFYYSQGLLQLKPTFNSFSTIDINGPLQNEILIYKNSLYFDIGKIEIQNNLEENNTNQKSHLDNVKNLRQLLSSLDKTKRYYLKINGYASKEKILYSKNKLSDNYQISQARAYNTKEYIIDILNEAQFPKNKLQFDIFAKSNEVSLNEKHDQYRRVDIEIYMLNETVTL